MSPQVKHSRNSISKRFDFDDKWKKWLEENLRLNVPEREIIKALVRNGCSRPEAERYISGQLPKRRESSPKRLLKTKWLLNSLRSIQHHKGVFLIPEKSEIEPEEFFEHFYRKNFPVIFRSCLNPGELTDQLSWSTLRDRFSNERVEVQARRNSSKNCEAESKKLKEEKQFSDFLEQCQGSGGSDDFYMTANNSAANRKLIRSAIDARSIHPDLLDPQDADTKVFLWIGPEGTVTPCHHDLTNNLFMQVHGEKAFQLASSFCLLEVENDFHCYTRSSLAELEESREKQGLPRISVNVVLSPGDVLFIPLGWWHEVRSLSPSISVSATNFRERNDYYKEYDFFGNLT